jgi:hypothetical protein
MMTNTLKQHLQKLHLSGLLSSLELRLQEAEANRYSKTAETKASPMPFGDV